jgi:CDP-paratose synthetase
MNILLTGGTGFIGSHLIKRLQKEGHSVHLIARPHSKVEGLKGIHVYTFDGNVENLTSYIESKKINGVIHLASLFLAQHKPEQLKDLIESNVLFSTQVLEAASKSNVKWFINTGTFWQHHKDKAYSPVNLYAATKQAFETIAQYYRETSSLSFVTLKLSDTFGPHDTRSKVFNLWVKISATGETLGMSPGKQIMDISYIDNVIDGFIQLMKLAEKDPKKVNGKSYALQSSERMTLQKLSKVFEEVTGKKLSIIWGEKEYRPREVMVPWRKGKKIPGWKQNVSLREGIKRTFTT